MSSTFWSGEPWYAPELPDGFRNENDGAIVHDNNDKTTYLDQRQLVPSRLFEHRHSTMPMPHLQICCTSMYISVCIGAYNDMHTMNLYSSGENRAQRRDRERQERRANKKAKVRT